MGCIKQNSLFLSKKHFSKKFVILTLIALSSVAISVFVGCGYHFKSGKETKGIEINSIAIPLMESTSSSLGFESDFTRIIREEFISHTRVPLVSKDRASAVLIGKIVEVSSKALGYDLLKRQRKGEEYTYEITDTRRLYIELEAKLVERATGNIVWSDRGMKERASYRVTTDPMTNRYNRKQAIRRMARRFAERMFLKTIERF
ncbi:LPS assembly lipoprotein LptE [Thermodesulfobacteriota bacterium]